MAACHYIAGLIHSASLSLQSEDGSDKASPDRTHPTHHDNGISVRHIVTEIEAISHIAASPSTPSSSSSSSLPPSSHSPQLVRTEHQEGTEASESPHSSFTPPSHPPSPSTLPCDWPAGSVRRATKQLEERLKQELEMAASQRSPLHSPSTEQPPLGSPLHPAEQRITQGENLAVSAKSKDGEKHAGTQKEQRLDFSGTDNLKEPSCTPNSHISQVSGAIPIIMHTSIDSHIVTSSLDSASHLVEASLDTSAQSQRQGQLLSQNLQSQTVSQAASNQVSLDGATVQESDTDERLDSGSQCRRQGCGPDCEAQIRLTRGSQELERIQQTLQELQAFLHEGSCLEATDSRAQEQRLRDAMDTEPGHYKGARSEHTPPGLAAGQRLRDRHEGRSLTEQTGWHRAMELEARIRQAGLTPPSLMKRSASLAKLDCLELSANDLSDLDLRPHNRTTSSHSQNSFSLSQCHHDDTWKKQKVLSQSAGTSSDDTSSPPSPRPSSSSHGHSKEDKGERDEPDGSGGSSSAVSTSRQQGRGHSSRRSRKASSEKKQRAVALLYNTM